MPGYHCFPRNRTCEDGGGIATCIVENERLHTLKLVEGDADLEMVITRHGQFQTPINIINLYGYRIQDTKLLGLAACLLAGRIVIELRPGPGSS